MTRDQAISILAKVYRDARNEGSTPEGYAQCVVDCLSALDILKLERSKGAVALSKINWAEVRFEAGLLSVDDAEHVERTLNDLGFCILERPHSNFPHGTWRRFGK